MLRINKIEPQIFASVLYTIATFIGQGMTFLGIIVFSRIMSQEDYGNYSSYYAYVAIFVAFAGANLYCSIGNAYIDYKDNYYEFKKTVLCLSFLIASIMTIASVLICSLFFFAVPYWIVIFAAIHAYSFFVINYGIQAANMERDYRFKAVLLVLPFFLQFVFALFAVLIFPNASLYARIIGSTFGTGLVAILIFYKTMIFSGRLIRIDYWIYALKISLPSIISSVSYMIMQQCDKVMITKYCGAEKTAVYSVIFYMSYAVIALNSAISPVRMAWIYRKLDTGNISDTKVLQKWYLILMLILATFLMMLGELIIMMLAPKEYWEFGYIVPFILSACAMIMYGFYMEILEFYKMNIQSSCCVLFCACVNVFLNALMIPRYGAVAACYTTVFAYILLFVLTMIISNSVKSGVYSFSYFVYFMLWMIIMSIVYFVTHEYYVMRYICFVFIILMIGVFIYLKRAEWGMIIRK